MALIFGFHFLILNPLPSPPNYITEGGRPERSLLLRGPSLWVLGGGAGGWAAGIEVLRTECKPVTLQGQAYIPHFLYPRQCCRVTALFPRETFS